MKEANTQIMGANFKNTAQVVEALEAGAHTATIPADIFEAFINREIAINAIDVFNAHGKELRKKYE